MALKPKSKTATVTISMNRDGTYNFRSRNYDLRKLFPPQVKSEEEATAEPEVADANIAIGNVTAFSRKVNLNDF